MKLAVMGCVVNGPGESKHANIGISLPGTFEEPKAPVYVDGRLFTTLKGDRIVAEFIDILDEYVDSHYAAREDAKRRSSGKKLSNPATPALVVAQCATTLPTKRVRGPNYCPINKKIGLCKAVALLASGLSSRSVITVSAGWGEPELFVLPPVVLITAIAPASHMLTYTRCCRRQPP